MRQNFRIGLGCKFMIAVATKLLLERLVIFDYAIMNQRDLAGGVEMRVRVLVVDFSMRSPTGMADAERAGGRIFRHQFGQRFDATRALARLDVIAVDNSYAGRVVSSIFEAAQPIE